MRRLPRIFHDLLMPSLLPLWGRESEHQSSYSGPWHHIRVKGGAAQEVGTSAIPLTFTSPTAPSTVGAGGLQPGGQLSERAASPRPKHRMFFWETRWGSGGSTPSRTWAHRGKQASMQDLRHHKGKITDSTTRWSRMNRREKHGAFKKAQYSLRYKKGGQRG